MNVAQDCFYGERMGRFAVGSGDWTEYRKLPGVIEVDFHHEVPRRGEWLPPYHERMELVAQQALASLQAAYADLSVDYVLFTHGRSTSRPGATTSRSQVRKLMSSKEATPYIDRRRCILHESVFVAAIRRRGGTLPHVPDNR